MKKITFLLISFFIYYLNFAQYDIKTTWNLDFEDISTTGTNLNLGDDDEVNIIAPFDIYLGYQTSRNLRIANNGAILFDVSTGDVSSSNGDLTTSNPMIAPFWDDLDSELGGVYVRYHNSKYIIQWNRVHYDGGSYNIEAIFQIQFYEYSKDIIFVYQNVNLDGTQFDNGASATIGISTSTHVFQFSKDTSSLSGIQTITFIPDALTYVPDDNFEDYLENHINGSWNPYFNMGNGIENDNYVYTSHIELIKKLYYIDNESISSLIGIGDFKNIRILNFSNNNISTIDLSNNKKLRYLNFSGNNISTIDVSKNIMLNNIDGHNGNLNSLILNQNLRSINVSGNNLSKLDISYCSLLGEIYCYDNQLSGNLDLSHNPMLKKIKCSNNQISNLNIANGNNGIIEELDARFNTNLTCIQVDDTNLIGVDWQKDAAVQYNENCTPNKTYIPDSNFEQKLVALGYDDVIDTFVTTSNINTVTSLIVDALDISNLRGIEDFTALTSLNCNDNAIHNLDVSNNTNLTTLYCNNNDITFLDVSNNLSLVSLECATNRLLTLDLHLNTALTNVYCAYNDLVHLNIKNGNNYNIWGFWAHDNHDLYCIDVDDEINTPPTGNAQEWYKDPWANYGNNCYENEVYIADKYFENELEYMDLGNGAFDDHYVSKSKIELVKKLDISKDYSVGNITDLSGISYFTALTYLNCYNNKIINLDISQNTLLENLYFGGNQISDIDLSQNIALKSIGFGGSNNFTSINLDANINIESFDCYGNEVIETISIQNGANHLLAGLDDTDRGKVNVDACENLRCIFVDNAVDANNQTGYYEYWDKDSTAHYVQTQAECDNLLEVSDNTIIGLSLYPNPAKNTLNVKAINTIDTIQIYNMLGQVVLIKESTLNNIEIDLSTISSGNYIVKIQSNNKIGTYKLIKY